MTETELKQISINNHKLLLLKNQYEDMRYKSLAKGQVITGMPHTPGVKDSLGDYATDIVMLQEEIEILQHTNYILTMRAREFIDSIPDWIVRMVLEFRYINNIPEYSIPYLIGNGLKEKDISKIINIFFLDSLLYL